MSNNQDFPTRRIYVVKPRQELIDKLRCLDAREVVGDLTVPFVVMTDELPYEKYLEGWRKTILEQCKLNFIKRFILEFPWIPEEYWEEIPRISELSTEAFDLYWEAEEAHYLNIPTTWKHVET